ncbi:hypothetical protein EB73_07235 [Mycobacterium sp. SWH-M3]|nr:hypothetical protein EB73_07235 [Mycobacterium sp. SWH-M3]
MTTIGSDSPEFQDIESNDLSERIDDVLRRLDTDFLFDPYSRAYFASHIAQSVHPRIDSVEQLDTLPDGTVIHPLRTNSAVSSVEKRFGQWWPSRAEGPVPRSHLSNCVPARVLYTPKPHQFVVGQRIRARFPLRPDLHVDLIRHDDGWHRIDGTGPGVPYKDREVLLTDWTPLDTEGATHG